MVNDSAAVSATGRVVEDESVAVVRGEAARGRGWMMDGSAALVKGGAARGEGGIHRQQCDGVGG